MNQIQLENMHISLATAFSLSYFLKIVAKLLLFIRPIYMNCVFFFPVLPLLPLASCSTARPLIPVCICDGLWQPPAGLKVMGICRVFEKRKVRHPLS